jgi:hypothetical protein
MPVINVKCVQNAVDFNTAKKTSKRVPHFIKYIRPVARVEIQPYNRMFFPFPVKVVYCKSYRPFYFAKQFASPFKQRLHRGAEKRLAKTPRSGQKIRPVGILRQFVNEVSLVHIRISVLTKFIKTLYAYRQFSVHILIFLPEGFF